MPRLERRRIRKKIRFGRLEILVRGRTRLIIRIALDRQKERLNLRKSISDRIKSVEREIKRKNVYITSEKRREAVREIALYSKACLYNFSFINANYENYLINTYGLSHVYNKILELSQYAGNSLSGIPAYADSLTKELARLYYAPLNSTLFHATANMIKLTDLTINALYNKPGDFFIMYNITVGDLTNPYLRSSPNRNLSEFFTRLMYKKGKRERMRNKSKGHFGTIKYDEPIHTVINYNRVPMLDLPLYSLIGNTYVLARDKAFSLGRPELANRINAIGIFVIPHRKSKLSKKEELIKDDVLSYNYRFKYIRYTH